MDAGKWLDSNNNAAQCVFAIMGAISLAATWAAFAWKRSRKAIHKDSPIVRALPWVGVAVVSAIGGSLITWRIIGTANPAIVVDKNSAVAQELDLALKPRDAKALDTKGADGREDDSENEPADPAAGIGFNGTVALGQGGERTVARVPVDTAHAIAPEIVDLENNSVAVDSESGRHALEMAAEYLKKLKCEFLRIEIIGNGDPGGITTRHAKSVIIRNGNPRTSAVVHDFTKYRMTPDGRVVCDECDRIGFFMQLADGLIFMHSDDSHLEPAPVPPPRQRGN